jgi:mannan endo-1,4-beta-mannosidase
MRLRSSIAGLAAATILGTTALSAAPAQASGPPVLIGLISAWSGKIQTTAHDDSQVGIHSAIIGSFFNWAQTNKDPVINWMTWIHSRNAVPMVDLAPPAAATLAQISAGSQDGYLRGWADRMRQWGQANPDANGLPSTILYRLFPEMNGGWESYSPRTRGQTVAQFRAAFQHVVNVFRSRGATNVKWVWNPDRIYNGSTSVKALWPGAAYVDWVALDGYNWADQAHGTHKSPYELLHNSVTTIRGFTSKPLFIAELGCAPSAGKNYFMQHMVSAMQSLGAKALVYYDYNKEKNWRLDTTAANLAYARQSLNASNATWYGRVSFAQINHWAAYGGAYN